MISACRAVSQEKPAAVTPTTFTGPIPSSSHTPALVPLHTPLLFHTLTPVPKPSSTPEVIPVKCNLSPIIRPTLPAIIPGLYQLDEYTNLHVTGDHMEINPESYRLKVTGMVNRPLNLGLGEIRCMPKIETNASLVCASAMDMEAFFKDNGNWSGASLKYILEMAGIQSQAKNVIFHSADGYLSFFSIDEALLPDNFLAYEWNGQPLPVLHGFPIRAVLPSQLGGKWVKWLVEIKITSN